MIEDDDFEITDILKQYTDSETRELPWTDEMAWDQYPKLRWMYQKEDLIKYLGQQLPNSDLWVHKPCINFWGLGRGASVLANNKTKHGFFAMPFIAGDLYSTDYLVDGGRFLGSLTLKTKNDPLDIHNKILWKGVDTPSAELKEVLHRLTTEHLTRFTGMLNIEYIMHDGTPYIIEIHLRPSAQFYWMQPAIIKDWIEVMFSRPVETKYYSGRGLGSLVIRHELDYESVPEGVHVMRLNPADDLAAANKREYLVSGPIALLKTLSLPDSVFV